MFSSQGDNIPEALQLATFTDSWLKLRENSVSLCNKTSMFLQSAICWRNCIFLSLSSQQWKVSLVSYSNSLLCLHERTCLYLCQQCGTLLHHGTWCMEAPPHIPSFNVQIWLVFLQCAMYTDISCSRLHTSNVLGIIIFQLLICVNPIRMVIHMCPWTSRSLSCPHACTCAYTCVCERI